MGSLESKRIGYFSLSVCLRLLHPVIQLNYEVDIHILRPTNQALGKI